jgi:hypothetical protein
MGGGGQDTVFLVRISDAYKGSAEEQASSSPDEVRLWTTIAAVDC